jgi:CBS domain containing-hemolysin-like protein
VERATGLRLPESEDYDTVAGLIIARLGRLAEPGDEMAVPLVPDNHLLEEHTPSDDGVVVTVMEVQRRVPARVRLSPRVADPAWTGGKSR